jgi:uncharacterized protein YoxC
MVQSYVIAASTPGTVLRYAAAFFLIVVAVGMVYALIRLAQTLRRVDKLVEDTDREMVPLLSRAQVTLDQVNSELGKVDEILGSVVNVTSKVDATTNVVQTAVTAPAKKAAAFSAGVSQAVASFFARHDDEGAGAAGPTAGAQGPSWASTWSPGTGAETSAADTTSAGGASPAADEAAGAASASWEGSADAPSSSGDGASDSPVTMTGREGGAPAADASPEETSAT